MPTEYLIASVTICQCLFRGCKCTADITLAGQRLCRDHVLSICGERLDAAADLVENSSQWNIGLNSARKVIIECAEALTDLARTATDLTPFQQEWAMDCLLRVEGISQRLQRLHRNVILRRDLLWRSWKENAEIVDLSRAGAVLKCGQRVEVHEMLTMSCADTGQTARVRVLLCAQKKGYYELVVCFAERNDF